MDNLIDALGELMRTYPAWRYIIIGGSMIIQGELAILVLMYFVLNRFLTFQEFVLSSLGILAVVEILVYILGRFFRHTRLGWGFYKKIRTNKKVQLYSYYLKTNIGKLLIFSKFLPATSLLTLLLTGWARVKTGRFLKAYFGSLFLWFASMCLLAYFLMSGLTYLKTAQAFRGIEIAIAAVFALILVGQHFAKKLISSRFTLEHNAEDIERLAEEEFAEEEKNDPPPPPPTPHFLRG